MAEAQNDDDPLKPLWDKARAAAEAGDFPGVLFVWKALADKGISEIYAKIGSLYEGGAEGIKKSQDQALYWYRRAVFETDDPFAHVGLGRAYFNGIGVPQDLERAKGHFETALHKGEVEGALFLGVMYYLGMGVARDLKRARDYLESAAAAGYCYAYVPLGRIWLRQGRLIRALGLWIRGIRLANRIRRKDRWDPRLRGLYARSDLNAL